MARKSLTYKQVKEYIETRGYLLLSNDYKGAHAKLYIQCDRSHKYKTKWNDFQQGCRCPICAGNILTTYEYIRDFIQVQGYTLLSREYKNAHTKLLIECPEAHQYQASWTKFQQGCRCPLCIRKWIGKNRAKTYEDVQSFIEKQGCILLSKEYGNCRTKLTIQCPKEHQYQETFVDFQQGYRCPVCKESKGERKIRNILSALKFFYILQYKLPKSRLRLDFFIPSLKVGIEYDGEHHFMPVRYGGMSIEKAKSKFEKQKQNDYKKEVLCQQMNIKLIRFRYDDNLTEYLVTDNLISDKGKIFLI